MSAVAVVVEEEEARCNTARAREASASAAATRWSRCSRCFDRAHKQSNRGRPAGGKEVEKKGYNSRKHHNWYLNITPESHVFVFGPSEEVHALKKKKETATMAWSLCDTPSGLR